MTAEDALRLTEQGWIVGCNIEGRTAWMQWVHGGDPSICSCGVRKQPEQPITPWRDARYCPWCGAKKD